MEFMRGQFENELGGIAHVASTELNAVVSVKDITNVWAIMCNEEPDEFIYMYSIRNIHIGVVVHSTIDLKTRLSMEEARSIRIGFYYQNKENGEMVREYAEFGRLRRTENIRNSLSREVSSALKEVQRLATNRHNTNVKWEPLIQKSFFLREIVQNLFRKEKKKYSVAYYTGRTIKVSKANGIDFPTAVERTVKSVDGEKFIMMMPLGTDLKELVVDTKRRKIVRAVDYEGKDIRSLFSHLITEKDGLVVPRNAKPMDWRVREPFNKEILSAVKN